MTQSTTYLAGKPTLLSLFVAVWVAAHVAAQPSAFHPDGDAPSFERPSDPGMSLPPDPVEQFLSTQPLHARIAQLMLVTLEGVTGPSGNDLAFFKTAVPGGVVMGQAFKPDTAAGYVNALRETEKATGTPLLIGVDLYRLVGGGRVTPSRFLQLPTLLSVVAAGDSAAPEQLGRILAGHALGMGFNMHLGPTLTLAPVLDGAASATHTLGSDPVYAGEVALALFGAFRDARVLAVPMGFPGGSANRSGREAAVLTTPRTLLLESDARPYVELIAQGVPILHVGNVLAPTLDGEPRPASLSPAVITEILRGEMGCTGVVVSGPLDDETLQSRYESADCAVRALVAGADMLYWQGGLVGPMRAIERIARLVHEGALDEERINESVRRILTLKQTLPVPDKAIRERQAAKLSDDKTMRQECEAIERRAITLLKNDGLALPLVNKESTPVGVTGVVGVEELHGLLGKHIKPVTMQRITTARHLGEIQRFEIDRLTRHMSGLRTVVCVLTDAMRVETQIELIRALKGNAPQVVVVFLGDPRKAARLGDADAVLLAYCDPASVVGQTMAAMADILVGRGPVAILPVAEEILLQPGDTRSFNAFEVLRVPSGRLPIALGDAFPAGVSARYSPKDAVRRVEWDFAGRRIRRDAVAHTFDAAGVYPVTLHVTDILGETQSRTFTVRVE